jgi:hypothetical protein
VVFDDGRYPSSAAALARSAGVAIVFGNQWMTENEDAPDLSLPEGQDALIAAVAAANPRTIVVLQPGERKQIELTVDPRLLARFETASNRWHVVAGTYGVALSRSATDDVLSQAATLSESRLRP